MVTGARPNAFDQCAWYKRALFCDDSRACMPGIEKQLCNAAVMQIHGNGSARLPGQGLHEGVQAQTFSRSWSRCCSPVVLLGTQMLFCPHFRVPPLVRFSLRFHVPLVSGVVPYALGRNFDGLSHFRVVDWRGGIRRVTMSQVCLSPQIVAQAKWGGEKSAQA